MRIFSLTKRLLKQIIRDKRTMALLFVAPLFVLWLMSLVFTTSTTQSSIDLINAPSIVIDKLKETDATVHTVTLEDAKRHLENREIDGYIEFKGLSMDIMLEGSDPVSNKAVMQTLQTTLQNVSPATGVVKNLYKVSYLHGGESLTMLDYFAPILIGIFIFFFVFLISGVSFLRERTGGTLERILATPMRRYEIVLGYFLGFGIFALFQTLEIQWFSLQVIDIHSAGSFWSVLVITILIATVALSIGTFLSAFAFNEFQMVQFIPLVVVPQIYLSGLFDLRNMPDWVIWLSKTMPLTYATEALRGVMIRGDALSDVQFELWVLVGFCCLFLLLNVLALKRYRKV